MKLVVQRVKNANVEVDGKIVGKIGKGFLILLGVTHTDTTEIADFLLKKLCNLRVFEDDNGNKCKENNINVETGIFGADMKVSLLNDGPVTIVLEK